MDSLTKIDMDENLPGFYKTVLHQLYDRYSEIMEQPIVFEDYIDQKGTYPIIHALPKLDLHCHLGGCADLNNILSIANTFDKNPDYFIWLQEKIGDNAAIYLLKNRLVSWILYYFLGKSDPPILWLISFNT